MSKGIELSPKHGVNPTIGVCFFCGEDTGELALLGRIREKDDNGRSKRGSDVEAPRRMVLSYEPCDKCKENFAKGVALIGVTGVQPEDGRPPIQQDLYPTGSYMVVTKEAANRFFDEEVNSDRALVPQEFLDSLNAQFKELEGEE